MLIRKFSLVIITLLVGFLSTLVPSSSRITLVAVAAQSNCSEPASCSTPAIRTNIAGKLHWKPGVSPRIYIDPASFSASEISDIKAAANAWYSVGAVGAPVYLTSDPGSNSVGGTIRIVGGITGYLAATNVLTSAPIGSITNVVSGALIQFDHGFDNNGVKAYSAGQLNGGDAFFTLVMEHEIGHVLGALDFYAPDGTTEIDSPLPSVFGAYVGTNNQGIPPTGTTVAVAPGHLHCITICDKNAILSAEQAPSNVVRTSGGGGGPSPKKIDEGGVGAGSGGTGGSTTSDSTYVTDMFIIF